jgi:Sigma-70, region 4.
MGKRNKTDLKKAKSTKINKNQQNRNNVDYIEYDKLNPTHQRAIDLRLNGVKYKDIATELNIKEQTVRSWFIKDGICYFAFNQMKKEREKEKEIYLKKLTND